MTQAELLRWLRSAPANPQEAGAKLLTEDRSPQHQHLAKAVGNLTHAGPPLHRPLAEDAELLP
ncbi:hypothetical protein GO986_12155 [Deinococcus sp. HMF7620]|uniref:Uncharacterized protein n=1 Tax=Deinococcus arboris TaxID=2682977 RepID=A0A7C9LLI3_9DEIO|nr:MULTISPECIES: hypothetical protein [Deinococcus]MBZ9752130.1 hypothetical protein [Deinococcus betulae]MVN87518.1 hypothetical protein [Deinococcus arboris]